MGALLKTCWGLVARVRCPRCGLAWSVEGFLGREALFLFLFPPLILGLLGFALHQRFVEPGAWEKVEGRVQGATLHAGPVHGDEERFEVSYRLRYSVKGADYHHVRFSGGAPQTFDLTRAQAESAVAAVDSSATREPVYVLRGNAHRARSDLDFSHPWLWVLASGLAFLLSVGIVDDFAGRLRDMQTHHGAHSAPKRLLANFDRRALARLRLLGPVYSLSGLVAPLLITGALITNALWPWPGAFWLLLTTPLPLVGVARLAREAWLYARWRGVALEPQENAPFELGRSYTFRFAGSARRWRRARLEYRVEQPDEFDVWSGRVAAHAPIEVGEGLLTVTLPLGLGPSLGVQPRWRHDGRERWTIALPGAVHYDLDFAPPRPPEPYEVTLELPALAGLREQLGPAPRRFDPWLLDELGRLEQPDWAEDASYAEVYEQWQLLLHEGLLVWGVIVQANMNLYEPGEQDHPAMVLYSLDPHFDERPGDLRSMALRLGDTKDDPADRLSHVIADEQTDVYQRPLAPWIAGERDVWASSIMVLRRHLPDGVLAGRAFPLLVAPTRTRAPLILPSHFWPPELIAAWR